MGTLHKDRDQALARGAPERTRARAPAQRSRPKPPVPADLSRLGPEAISALQGSVGNRGLGLALQRQRPSFVGSEVAILRSSEPPSSDPHEPVLDRYRGQSVNKVGQISAAANQYQIAKTTGVNVRARPDGSLPPIGTVVYGTEAQVQALDTTGAFSFIIAKTGVVGWINKDFVALDPPDVGARLHHITEPNLTTILKNEYVDKNLWRLGTGNDFTTLAAAVVAANAGRKGVSVDWEAAEKYKQENPLKELLDPWMIDNFAIYHGSTVLAGHNIWLPSPAYVRLLQSAGAIGSRPGWINAAVDVGKGLAGFLAGIAAGVFGSLWDTLTGLWELGEGIVSAVRSVLDGSLFTSIDDIYDTITAMTWEDVKALVNAVITMGQDAFADFQRKWDHPDAYQQWHFKGYIVGSVALEVVLAIFSGGASLAAKVLAKIGKYFPKLMRVLNTLLELAKKFPGHRDRDRGDRRKGDRDRDDEDMSPADRGWEQARALAAIVTEGHDKRDTPVAVLIPLLNTTIAAKFQGVTGYQAIPLGEPNTYQVVQRTSRRRDVDPRYTERPGSPRVRDFEPPVRDHAGKLGGVVPSNGAERTRAVNSWSPEELEVTAEELRLSIAARQAEQVQLGETTVGAHGQAIGAAHRVRIEDELALLRAVERKLGR